MANVIFTSYCNRSCSYCFARREIDPGQEKGVPSGNMSLENLEKVIRFYRRSQLTRFAILGGEPTLHPEFNRMIDRILAEADFKSVLIFTNGLMPEEVLSYLSSHPDPRIRIALNLNSPEDHTHPQWERVSETMSKLGARIGLGINICRPGQDYGYLVAAIQRHKLSRHVRLGLTQPILGAQNLFAREEDLPGIAADIVKFAGEAFGYGINFSFDCGFRFCMFSLEQHKELLRLGIKFAANCSPIIDISPDLVVGHCFPLFNEGPRRLTDFQTKNQIVDFYRQRFRAFQPMGNKPECPQCRYRVSSLCNGGCLSRTLAGFNHNR